MIERIFKVLVGFALFLFPFSLFFIGLGKLPAAWGFVTSLVILLYATILFLWRVIVEPWAIAVRYFLGILGFGFALEWIGVSTGVPFGSYRYTDVLGIPLFGVPAVIPFAWYATIMSALGISSLTPWSQGSVIRTTIVAAFLVLALDLVLEPTARVKQYWVWEGDKVPAQNYLSWFLLAFILLLLILLRAQPVKRSKSPVPLKYGWAPRLIYGLQWLLFAFTSVFHGHGVAVLGSLVLAAGTLKVASVSGRSSSP